MSNTWDILSAPIPAEHIQQREGHGGKMLDYIDRPVVWQRLDEAAKGEWIAEFQPLPVRQDAADKEPYAMLCTLTVNGIRREGVGQGKDWKDAETDAFKRAAVHFGVGQQLYGTVGEAKPVPQRAAAPSRSKPSSKPSTSGPIARCPQCGGDMWDNRPKKASGAFSAKAPDFKCKDKECGGVIWPPKDDQRTPAPVGSSYDDELPAADGDALPF